MAVHRDCIWHIYISTLGSKLNYPVRTTGILTVHYTHQCATRPYLISGQRIVTAIIYSKCKVCEAYL